MLIFSKSFFVKFEIYILFGKRPIVSNCNSNEPEHVYEDKKSQISKDVLIGPSYIQNKDNYFTKQQIEYYELYYPYKEFEKTSKIEFNLKK